MIGQVGVAMMMIRGWYGWAECLWCLVLGFWWVVCSVFSAHTTFLGKSVHRVFILVKKLQVL